MAKLSSRVRCKGGCSGVGPLQGWRRRRRRRRRSAMPHRIPLRTPPPQEPELNKKIQECDAQLLSIKAQLAKCRTAGQQAPLKSRALVILRRRQQYIQQRDQLATRAFNLEQTTWAIESMREAKDHMTVMRSAADEMRTTFKDLDVGEMEDIHEDMCVRGWANVRMRRRCACDPSRSAHLAASTSWPIPTRSMS